MRVGPGSVAGYPYLVAVRRDEVVGDAYAGAYRPRAAYREGVENSVYLRPDAARQGVAPSLRSLIHECEALGFRQMIAVVGDSANVASVRLQERHGSFLVGTLRSVGFKHGR